MYEQRRVNFEMTSVMNQLRIWMELEHILLRIVVETIDELDLLQIISSVGIHNWNIEVLDMN